MHNVGEEGKQQVTSELHVMMGNLFESDYFSCFRDPATVRELAAAGERLVRLEFSEGLGSLYCHSYVLSSSSTVLRNVLEDAQQQQGQLCTIPLAGDTDVNVWKLALGLMYQLDTADITLDNAQALLLVADKWEMRRIKGKPSPLPYTPHPFSRLALVPSTCTQCRKHLCIHITQAMKYKRPRPSMDCLTQSSSV
jgi:hypothetical protein